MKSPAFINRGLKGILIACAIGIGTVLVSYFLIKISFLDPLVISLTLGILIRTCIKFDHASEASLKMAPSLFIPIGIIFYGAVNLNFNSFATIEPVYLFILFIVVIIYIISTLLLSHLFGIDEEISFLIAAGSAICGASAIAITSKAIDAKPQNVSNSLIPVFMSALIGLFVIIPLLSFLFNISALNYGIFSGTVLQFTGFVKVAIANLSPTCISAAIAIKATRYIALIFVIPLFASLAKGKIYIPWFLWAFLIAGIFFSFNPELAGMARPKMKIILDLLWCTAMAAIGLNADLKALITKSFLKAFAVSLISFILACGVFLAATAFL